MNNGTGGCSKHGIGMYARGNNKGVEWVCKSCEAEKVETRQFRVTDPVFDKHWVIEAYSAKDAAEIMAIHYLRTGVGLVDYDYFVVVPHNWNVCAQEDDTKQPDVFDLVSEETQFIKDNLQSLLTMYHGKSVKGAEVNDVLFTEKYVNVGVKQTIMGCTSWYVMTVPMEQYHQWKHSGTKTCIYKQYYDKGFEQWTVSESSCHAYKEGTFAKAFFLMGVHDAKHELEYDQSRVFNFGEI